MSRNSLEDIPELPIPELKHLNLSENQLTSVQIDMFFELSRLRELNLSHNLLHTLEYSFRTGEYLFSILEVIDLSSNQLTKLKSGFHYFMPNLKHLNISSNSITEFEGKDIGWTSHHELKLETFDMSRNRLKYVDFVEPWFLLGNVKHVSLSHNDIDLKGCREFADLKRLVWGCRSLPFMNMELEVVKLSHNQIAFIPMDFQHYLPNLRYVDLSHNKIKRLWHGDLLFTRARESMDLELFRTKNWTRDSFRKEFPGSNNLTIDLRHNSISSLQLPDDKIGVVIPGCNMDSKFSRVKLLLGHNPFVCDCEVFKLLRYASKEIRPTSALERLNGHMLVVPAVIDIQDLHCSEPGSMKGKAIADVDSWAYHWLPMIGICWNHLGVQSELGRTSTNTTEIEAMVEPPT
ncbi:leucine-rich repeats and immunoglobulin-like domains protein 1 isoform X2 [Ischnura elegans]|nr:leucine-rich repeats and immunoglobulin-like domains protein 1 isoform X2 [Ischnura elegans]